MIGVASRGKRGINSKMPNREISPPTLQSRRGTLTKWLIHHSKCIAPRLLRKDLHQALGIWSCRLRVLPCTCASASVR